jgi:PAS domain S-box-containing protein
MNKLTSLKKNGGGNISRDTAAPKRRPGSVKDAERKRTDKRAGEIQKESEEKYRSLFEQTMDAVMITDMETGIILEANRACAAMFGYPREKLTGMPHHALQPEDKKDGYKKHLNERLQKETTFSGDLVYRCADGKEIQVNVFTTILNMNGKRVMQSIFRENTERNSLLKKMMESEEKFSRAFQASPEAMSISDLTDGRFIEVNESYIRITGYTREELLNRNAENFNMWATTEDRKKMLEPLERHERLNNIEVDFRTKDGKINTMLTSSEFVQISGRPCLLVVSTDITEYKRMEQSFKDTEEKFSQAFYSSPASMCIFTVEDSKFTEVNDSYTRFTGYSREELIGHTGDDFSLFVSQEEKDSVEKSLRETGAMVNLRIRSRMKSGEIRTGLFTAQAFTINNKKHLILTINDITDQVKAQEAIANEATLRHVLIHDSSDGIVILDGNGKVYEANKRFSEMIGYTPEETLELYVENWEYLYTREKLVEMLRTVDEAGDHFETQHRRKDGSIYDVDISTNGAVIAGKKLIFCVCRDITQRKQIENALKASEEKFSKAFRAIPETIAISRVKDGVFVEANDNFCRVVRRNRDEIIGHTNTEIGIIATPGQRAEIIKTIQTQGGITNKEINTNVGNGVIRTTLFSADIIDIGGEPCMISISTDITEHKRMEEALAKEAIRHHILIEQSTDGIVILDGDGAVREANLRFSEMIGYTPEETLKLHVDDWEYLSTHETLLDMLRTMDQSGGHFETKHRRKDGSIYDVEISTNGAIIAGQKFVFCVCRDITQRKRMEEALKASEEKFSKAFRSIPESIAISRVSDGVIVDANDNFCRVANRPYDEVIGHTDSEINLALTPGNRDKDIKTIREKGGIKNREMVFNANTEKMVALLFSADIIDFGGEPCVISISTNITERKRMEQALENDAVRRRILIEQSRDGIVIIDQNGKVYEANRRFAEMHGYTPEEVLKLHLWDWEKSLPPEKLLENVQLRDEKGANFEARHYRKDGSVIDVEVSSNGTTYAGQKLVFSVVRDISERKRMEKALRESEEKFSKAIDVSGSAICLMSLPDNKFVEINKGYTQFTGYTAEEVIGRTPAELNFWVDDKERGKLQDTLKKGNEFHNQEFHSRMKSGEIRIGLSSAEVVNIKGKPYRLNVIQDITENRKAEEKIRESEEKFSKVFSTSSFAIGITSLASEKFIEVNDAFCRFTGYSREETIGHRAAELNLWVKPEELANWIKILTEEGRAYNVNFTSRMKSGEIRFALASAEVINIGNDPCRIVMITDITDLKRAEEKMAESEEKFSKAFHTIPETVSISRLRDGMFVDVNESFCRHNGLTREQIIGHTAVELGLWVQSGGRDKVFNAMNEQTRLENVEQEFKVKNGEIRTVLVSADVFNINGEPHILTIGNDITDRKRMELALRESEEKFSKAFHAIPEGVSISTVNGGVFLDVNESFLRATGFTREQVIGHTADDLKLWNTSEEHKQMIRSVVEHGSVVNEERQFVKESGETITLLFSANIIHIAGEPCIITITNNITERKRMEQAVRESEEKFSKAFHAIPESVSIVTENGGIYIDVNESFLRANQLTREQAIGHSAVELKIGNNPAIHEEMVRSVKEHGSIVNEDRQLITESGEEMTLLFSASMIQIAGKPCIITISNNITERKQGEKQLKKALAELQSSAAQLKATNKELESFSYSVSHDLRSPLRSIDGFSQALLEDYAPNLDETARDYLNRMRSASQKMGELIDGLLKLSRLTRNDMHYESVDLSALAQDIAARLQETDPERKAEFIITPGLKAAGDAQMLRVMLENLVGNAWKFTRKVPQARIEFGSSVSGGEETFFIKDNGAGFDMAYRDKLFSAFQRLHDTRDFPGTGIGLATVQRIINRHGGAIRAEGAVGRGASFYFSL